MSFGIFSIFFEEVDSTCQYVPGPAKLGREIIKFLT